MQHYCFQPILGDTILWQYWFVIVLLCSTTNLQWHLAYSIEFSRNVNFVIFEVWLPATKMKYVKLIHTVLDVAQFVIRKKCFFKMFKIPHPRNFCNLKIWHYTVVYSGDKEAITWFDIRVMSGLTTKTSALISANQTQLEVDGLTGKAMAWFGGQWVTEV